MAKVLRTRTCPVWRRADNASFPRCRYLHDVVEPAWLHPNTRLACRRAQSLHTRTLPRTFHLAFSEEEVDLVQSLSAPRSTIHVEVVRSMDQQSDAEVYRKKRTWPQPKMIVLRPPSSGGRPV